MSNVFEITTPRFGPLRRDPSAAASNTSRIPICSYSNPPYSTQYIRHISLPPITPADLSGLRLSTFFFFFSLKAFQALVKLEHWETAAGPARWLQKPTPAPESFGSPEQAEAYWRRWGRLAYGGVVGSQFFMSIRHIYTMLDVSLHMFPPPYRVEADPWPRHLAPYICLPSRGVSSTTIRESNPAERKGHRRPVPRA